MSKEPRVPTPNSPREVEDWRIRLARGLGVALIPSDVLGEDGQIVVTINEDGTITISIDDSYLPDSVLGTENQVIVTDNGDGTITLSTPQDIDTDADVEFDSLILDDLTPLRIVSTDATKKIVSISDLTAWIAGTDDEILVTNDGDGSLTLSIIGLNPKEMVRRTYFYGRAY